MGITSSCKRYVCLFALMLGFFASIAPQPAQAQTAQTLPAALAGIVPLADQAMRHISGAGLFLAKATPSTPGTGNVVLWDEVARNPRVIPKTIPGFRITVNGVPQ